LPRYTDDSRDKVREAVDFADLVGQRTELRRAGVNRLVGLCPFHDERSPSFGIDPVEKLYHCFGCGAGGDLFTFVMETESVGFGEALELLADRYNVPLERSEEDPRAAERRQHRDRLHALLERTAAWYVRLLWESDDAQGAREYLASRGLSESVCREFRVGYSPAAWDRVVLASQHAGYSAAELLASGLASRARGGSGLVDRFRGRLMFPWADTRGRVLGFGARSLSADDEPKYLNSSENDVFSKGKQVYGTYLARAAAAKAGSVVLVEGYTDVIALHQAGLRNVVGQMGTALTEGQAGELAKLAPVVVLCLDADRAGQDATAKASGVLRKLGTPPEVRVAALPEGKDPADLATGDGGSEAVAALLDRALPLARWHIELALSRGDLNSTEGRDRVLDYAAPIINRLPAGLLRGELTQLVGDRLGLSESVAAARLSESGRPIPAPANGTSTTRRPFGHAEDAERAFLALCLALPTTGRQRLAELDPDAVFTAPLLRRAAIHLRDHYETPASGLPSADEALSALIAELVMRARAMEEPETADLHKATLMLDRARLQRQIAAARAAAEPVTELAAEHQRVLAELSRLTV
jgi:DNA primase